MALKTISDEQIQTWSRAQKDRWWRDNVYRGDMPQLTLRSALTGFILGGVPSATALYIGGKTGISIGVGLTSVLLTFALFRLLAQTPLGRGFTLLENNCTQSIATAAGYMITPLISSMAAYMLGAKPRQQAVGHVIGIFAGAIAATPLFFLLFLPADKQGARSTATLVSEQFAMPGALQWKGVADLIAQGVSNLPVSAIWSMGVAAIGALTFEILRIRTKGRFPISAVSVGLGVVLPPEATLAMWIGAFILWWQGRDKPAPGSWKHAIWVDGAEPICAGLISGAAIIGIGNALVNVMLQ